MEKITLISVLNEVNKPNTFPKMTQKLLLILVNSKSKLKQYVV